MGCKSPDLHGGIFLFPVFSTWNRQLNFCACCSRNYINSSVLPLMSCVFWWRKGCGQVLKSSCLWGVTRMYQEIVVFCMISGQVNSPVLTKKDNIISLVLVPKWPPMSFEIDGQVQFVQNVSCFLLNTNKHNCWGLTFILQCKCTNVATTSLF